MMKKNQEKNIAVMADSEQKKAPGWKSVKFILGNETFEKMASMSLMTNLLLYMRTMYNLDIEHSVNIMLLATCSSNTMTLLGAFVADSFLGKFKTIVYATVVSFLGMSLLALTAGVETLRPLTCPTQSAESQHPPEAWQMGFLYVALALLSVGSAGFRPCIVPFSADQFDTATAKGREQVGSLCNWYFFIFTIGLIFVLSVVTYVQNNISWFFGFLLPSLCYLASIAVLLHGRRHYVLIEPRRSLLLQLPKLLVAAFRKRSTTSSGDPLFYEPAGKTPRTARLAFLDKAAIIVTPGELDAAGDPVDAWRLCSLQSVENCKRVIASFPVILVAIGCFIGMSQTSTFGILQALQMNRVVGESFRIQPPWVNVTIMASLSIWVVFYEKVYVGWMKKKRLTVKDRFSVGIILSILCMFSAGVIENIRRETALRANSFESPISVLYLMFPFAMAGLIEAFAGVTLMEYFTLEWPEIVRTVAGAVFFVTLSVAGFMNSVILWVVERVTAMNGSMPWLGGVDLNNNRLDYYYYAIGGLGVINLLYFHGFAKHFIVDSEDQPVLKDTERSRGLGLKEFV